MEKAVVGVAVGTVNGLIGKLGSVLADEALLLAGVRGEIEYIKDELEIMNVVLVMHAEKEDCNPRVKIWIKQVREMAYDIEDCIDKFRYHIDQKNLSLKARHQIATKIKNLKERTRVVSDREKRYHISTPSEIATLSSGSLIPYISQLQAMFPKQVQLVGFVESRDTIVGWLKDEDRTRLTVVSIVGFGGMGKTSLAKMVYESLTVKAANFQCQAFVVVSQQFDIKQLLVDVLRQVNPIPNMENLDEDTPHGKLRECLNKKRYLIIIDDIWDISVWEHFKIALPDCNNGSRIIVTTRIESIANECSRDNEPHVYKMKPLDSDAAKTLFYKRILGTNDEPPSDELDQISNDILKKCGGMPLAINTIAGLLANKPKQPDQWKTILNSLGSELETNPTLEGMRKILFLSYQHLPHYLKTCFLYLSIYPEDYSIRTRSVMRRWVAEGFVSTKRGMRVEDVAKNYFYELVNRSMVIPDIILSSGEIKSFRVHDIMLEIIVSKSFEENFVSLVDSEYNLTNDHKVRRLSVHSNSTGQNNLESSVNMNLSHVRSLTIFGNWTEWVNSKQLKLVRVLDLEETQGLENDHLKYLGNMFQLRYLSLRGTDISELPSELKKLQNLETLDIRNTNIEKLPADIVNLQNLSYINVGYKEKNLEFYKEFGYTLTSIPRGVRNMKNIRTLTLINPKDYSIVLELGELSQITKFGVFLDTIGTEEELESFFNSIENLCLSLRSLAILKYSVPYLTLSLDKLKSPPTFLKSLQLRCWLEKLPLWFPFLNNLMKLKLSSTKKLKENDFQILQKLPNLTILHQGPGTYEIVDKLVFVVKGFPSLLVFTYESKNIPTFEFRERAAPKLEKFALAFGGNPKLVNGIENLQSLKEVILKLPPRSEFNPVVKSFQDVIDSGFNKFNLAVDRSYWRW